MALCPLCPMPYVLAPHPLGPLPLHTPSLSSHILRLSKLGEEEAAKAALVAIHAKFATMTTFLSDEDDDVSEEIIPFAAQYVGLLKVESWAGQVGRAGGWGRW